MVYYGIQQPINFTHPILVHVADIFIKQVGILPTYKTVYGCQNQSTGLQFHQGSCKNETILFEACYLVP